MASAPAAAVSRPGSNGRLFIFAGLGMAVVAFLGVLLIGGISSGVGGAGGPQVQVVVAAQDIPFRATIEPVDITVRNMAEADVPPQAYLASSKSSVLNSVAELAISKGQPITQNMLAKNAASVLAPTTSFLPLPSGWVAYTMPTSEQQGVGGYPQVGDYLTVLASADVTLFSSSSGQQQGPAKFVVKTVFTNLRIIRIGPAGGTAAGGVASSLTVEMTQCDAEFMTWLEAKTSLRYTLESYHDYAPAPASPDPSCPSVQAAHGVSSQQVDARWHFSAV